MTMYKVLKNITDNDIKNFSKYDLKIDSTTATGDHDQIINDLIDNNYICYTHTISDYDDETGQIISSLMYYEITNKGRDFVKNQLKSNRSKMRNSIFSLIAAVAGIIAILKSIIDILS